LAGPAESGAPQLPQNLVPGAMSLPQFLHFAIPTGVPQFEQNFSDPTGLPQLGHSVARALVSPEKTFWACTASRIWSSST
jgi:hypothetical protein